MAMMNALLCEYHGPPENLIMRQVPIPVPGKGEVLIRIHAAGLNFPDCLIIQDKYQFKPALPFSPGGELAGVVAATGDGVTRFCVGDRVGALTNWGAFADYIVADEGGVTHLPDFIDFETGAVLTLAYGTVHHALKQRASLKAGESLLVLGAAGGVGLAAIEIGKAMGARVVAAASSDEKLALARKHGADDVINYTDYDLKAKAKELAGPCGFDVIFDPVGGNLAEPAFRSVAWGGRFLVIGFAAGGAIPAIPLNLPLIKGAAIIGVFWGDFVRRSPVLHQENMAELYQMVKDQKIHPFISQRYPLAQAGKAIRAMMNRTVTGKVAIEVNP